VSAACASVGAEAADDLRRFPSGEVRLQERVALPGAPFRRRGRSRSPSGSAALGEVGAGPDPLVKRAPALAGGQLPFEAVEAAEPSAQVVDHVHERRLARAGDDRATVRKRSMMGEDDVQKRSLELGREAAEPLDQPPHAVVAKRDLAAHAALIRHLNRPVAERVDLKLAKVMQQRSGHGQVAVDAGEGGGDCPDRLRHREAVLEQPVAVGLVVVLGGGRLAEGAPGGRAPLKHSGKQPSQMGIADGGDQLAQVALHLGRVPRGGRASRLPLDGLLGLPHRQRHGGQDKVRLGRQMLGTAIVTGGTGGLGAAVVARLLGDGWRVVVPWIVERELERVGEHERLKLIRADLFEPESAAEVVRLASADSGAAPLRGVVNLVGGFAVGGRVHETPVEEFEAQLRLNLRPTYLVTSAALPVLLANEPPARGSIVCVGSRAALQPFPGAAGYIAAKAAVIAFAQAVAAEYRHDGVRCNAILPSVIDTPANREAMPNADHSRWVRPEQIAAVIARLLSDDFSPTSGAAIPVYGRA